MESTSKIFVKDNQIINQASLVERRGCESIGSVMKADASVMKEVVFNAIKHESLQRACEQSTTDKDCLKFVVVGATRKSS